ncbi:uncharacterized protein LOC144634180 [Oculina patagonica]
MDSLKDLLAPKTFNRLSFVVVVFWILLGVILCGIFADMERFQRFDFSCDEPTKATESQNKDFVQKCFERYEKQYNKFSIPFYGFVIVNFSVIGIVCVIYSQIVKSIINELATNADIENQGSRRTRRQLFGCYFCQLCTRLAIGVFFIVLQTQLFYPSGFPSNFNCSLTDSLRGGNRTKPPGRNVTQQAFSQTYSCRNQRATFWTNAVIGINGIFSLIILIEIICILSRARKGKKFMENANFLADHLLESSEEDRNLPIPLLNELQLQEFLEGTRDSIIRGTEQLLDLRSLFPNNPGEGSSTSPKDQKLDQIYIHLAFHPGRAKYDFNANRQEQLYVYSKPKENLTPMQPEDIVDAQNKNVLIVGRAGIGKTLFCKKLQRDWACGKVFSEAEDAELSFAVSFLFTFKRFNTSENLNLRELLARSEYSHTEHLDDEVWKFILENPAKVLLLFDGLDEYAQQSNIADGSIYANNVAKKMPLSALYEKLASGKLLSGATVLTTSRASAASSVRYIPFNRTFEILGFTPEQVKEYVQKFTEDDNEAREIIWKHISTNRDLFSLCYIPVNSFIVCSCLQQVLKFYSGTGARLPTKFTDIYKQAIKMFFFKHSGEYRNITYSREEFESETLPPRMQEVFSKLGEIAFNGINEGRQVFGTSEVKGLEDSGLLHRLPDLQSGPFKHEAQYCFIHLTVQEFLAAKYLTDTMNGSDLRSFVSDHIKNGAWQVVMQFLAGLLNDGEEPAVEMFTDLLPVSTAFDREEREDGEDAISDDPTEPTSSLIWWPSNKDKRLALTLFKCIFENNESDSVVQSKLEDIGFNAVDFSDLNLAPFDCSALLHVLKNVKGISCMNLNYNHIGSLGCLEIRQVFEMADQSMPSISGGAPTHSNSHELSSLSLCGNEIRDEGLKYLSEVLTQSNCKLSSLSLGENQITDGGVQHLSVALIHGNCKLNSLNLAKNQITDKGIEHLVKALTHSNCNLNNLNFDGNQITDGGARHLSKALSHYNCALSSLNLPRNEITDIGIKHFCEALANSNCMLSKLNLCYNNITDESVKYVSVTITHINCKLRKLNLGGADKISDEGIKHLSKALTDSNCKISSLNLYYNKVTDEGVKRLSEALVNSNCKLKSLNLTSNRITDEGIKDLSEALTHSNCTLSSLNVYANKITNAGVKHMSEALTHSNCKLSRLNLGGADNQITDKGAKYLSEALSHSNSKLSSLNLYNNKLSNDGVKHLSKALTEENCKLCDLNIGRNQITNEGLKHLSIALTHNHCKLSSLNLYGNEIADEGVKYLSESLIHSNCKLISLNLGGHQTRDLGVEHLSEALAHSDCKLGSLDLSDNNITDKGVYHLSTALAHSKCNLSQLFLYGTVLTDKGKRCLQEANCMVYY